MRVIPHQLIVSTILNDLAIIHAAESWRRSGAITKEHSQDDICPGKRPKEERRYMVNMETQPTEDRGETHMIRSACCANIPILWVTRIMVFPLRHLFKDSKTLLSVMGSRADVPSSRTMRSQCRCLILSRYRALISSSQSFQSGHCYERRLRDSQYQPLLLPWSYHDITIRRVVSFQLSIGPSPHISVSAAS